MIASLYQAKFINARAGEKNQSAAQGFNPLLATYGVGMLIGLVW
jgi:hypothetical protein